MHKARPILLYQAPGPDPAERVNVPPIAPPPPVNPVAALGVLAGHFYNARWACWNLGGRPQA